MGQGQGWAVLGVGHVLAHTFAFTLQLTPQGQWQCSYAIYECCVALFCCCEATKTHTHAHARIDTHVHVRLLHKLMYNGLPQCICMHLCTLNVHLRQQPHINSNTRTHIQTHSHTRSRTCICKANLYLCCS